MRSGLPGKAKGGVARSRALRPLYRQAPFPLRRVVAALCISYPTYRTIPEPNSYRTFVVLRNPRDTVVSWDFHGKNSDSTIPPMPELRGDLNELGLRDGLKYMIDRLEQFGSFEAQRSWVEANDPGGLSAVPLRGSLCR